MDDINKLQLIFQTLSDQNRLKIIREIDRSEKSVSEITDALQLSQPLISHHLKSLKKTGILITRRNGPFIFYRLKEPLLLDLLGSFLNIFQEMDMCQKIMKGINNAQVQATYATPELRGLFEEWIIQIEEEIYEFFKGKEKIDLQEAVDHFHLKEESIQYVLARLTREGKLEIKPF